MSFELSFKEVRQAFGHQAVRNILYELIGQNAFPASINRTGKFPTVIFNSKAALERFSKAGAAFRQLNKSRVLHDAKGSNPIRFVDINQIIRAFLLAEPRKPVKIFMPWGPRYKASAEIKDADPEHHTIKRVVSVLRKLHTAGLPLQASFMYADSYGVNAGLAPPTVREYGRNVVTALKQHFAGTNIPFELVPHSKLMASHPRYSARIKEVETTLANPTSRRKVGMDDKLYRRLLAQAKQMTGRDGEQDALHYAAERIVEAEHVATNPLLVKVSLVGPHHDELDLANLEPRRRLPTAYVIPGEHRRPWMMARE
ncbi:MAG: hypothetical protein Q8R15_01025 [Candidatus Micrarchaeota archaeon]|nr:hypothetical protein [Candidatus Micrarchaeota archaeon]